MLQIQPMTSLIVDIPSKYEREHDAKIQTYSSSWHYHRRIIVSVLEEEKS
jgi:hypothetical protein